MTVGLLCVLLLGLAAGAVPAESTPPQASLDGERIVITSIPDIFGEPAVQENLTTGLTTSLRLSAEVVDQSGHATRSGLLVEIRYELWEERFLLRTVSPATTEELELVSAEELSAWWRSLILAVPARGLDEEDRWRIRVQLAVLPFSQLEEQDARRWFLRSVRPGDALPQPTPSGADPEAPAAAEAPGNSLLELVMTTGIRRQSVLSYDWRIVLTREERR